MSRGWHGPCRCTRRTRARTGPNGRAMRLTGKFLGPPWPLFSGGWMVPRCGHLERSIQVVGSGGHRLEHAEPLPMQVIAAQSDSWARDNPARPAAGVCWPFATGDNVLARLGGGLTWRCRDLLLCASVGFILEIFQDDRLQLAFAKPHRRDVQPPARQLPGQHLLVPSDVHRQSVAGAIINARR